DAVLLGRAEPCLGAGRGREHDGVDLPDRRGLDGRAQHLGVRRRSPAVHDEARDLGARLGEHDVEPVGARTVVLEGDAQARDPLAEEHVRDLGGRLGLRDPVGREPGGLDRAARLGAARDDPRVGEHLEQSVGEAGHVRGLDPGPEADARGDDHDVRRVLHEVARPGEELGVVRVREHAQRRRVADLRAPAAQGRGELALAAVRGDEHGAARHRLPERGARPADRDLGAVGGHATGAGWSRPSAATSPITMIAGARTPTWAARSTTTPSVARVTRWRGVEPLSTIATGSAGSAPAPSAWAVMRASCETPMRTTSVAVRSRTPARAPASRPSCPLVTWKAATVPRCVSGMSASAGTLSALETPGTTSTGTPASRHATTSSPPRPYTNGSPPLRRTTCRPRCACSTRIALISC